MTVLRSGSATDVGRVRKINQDLPLETDNLYAVADGMGGHVGGEVAARVAVESLDLAFHREPTLDGLRSAFAEANRAVWQESQSNPNVRGMGTTLTAVALVGDAEGHDTLALANVGDSRAYLLSGDEFMQVTADHSLAEERMRHGEMTEEEAAVHPQRHILTRALGVYSEVEADMWELRLQAGDRVILCSDGLSNEVPMEAMADVLRGEADPTQAARALVDLANTRGGSDNITVVVVDVLVGEQDGERASSEVVALGDEPAPVVLGAAGASAAASTMTLPINEDPADAVTGMVPAVGPLDETSLVPAVGALGLGAHVGFGGAETELSAATPPNDPFFATNTAPVPLARASTRVVPERRAVPLPPSDESRGARRRRLGIPRRITLRVFLFLLLVLSVPTAAFFVIRWYAYDNWFLALSGNQIVIKQGQPGGVLWFKPRVVDRTGVTTSKVLPPSVTEIKAGVQEPSLSDAKHFVAEQEAEYNFLHSSAKSGAGSNAVGPNGSIPNITAPTTTTSSTTTTTMPGQTTVPSTDATTVPTTPDTTPDTTPTTVATGP
jgi:protein phosphatase